MRRGTVVSMGVLAMFPLLGALNGFRNQGKY